MNIREISKPITAQGLNESLAKRFGQKIDIDAFTLEQLQDARNRIRTKLSQVEMNENFDSVIKNEGYQKSKLFLDVLNAAISEREDISEASDCDETCPKSCPDCGGTGDPEKYKEMKEAAKPDYIDIDGDGDKEEPMKKAADDKKNKGIEAMKKAGNAKADAEAGERKKTKESIVREGAEDEAELVMAAKDMVDRVTGWMEDTAEMQTESMLELADAIRDEMGSEKSEAFVASVKPALESLYAAMESTRGTLTSGVGMLTGEGDVAMGDPMADPAMDAEAPIDDLAADMEPIDGDDGMGAAEPAAGGEEEAGRAKRESKSYSKKKIAETSRKLATTLSKKKK